MSDGSISPPKSTRFRCLVTTLGRIIASRVVASEADDYDD